MKKPPLTLLNIFIFMVIPIIILEAVVVYYLISKNKKHEGVVTASIVTHIKEKCANTDPCTVRMTDFTPFAWDAFYSIGSGAELEKELHLEGVKLPEKYSFAGPKFVFIFKKEIVVFEERPVEFEDMKKDGIVVRAPVIDGEYHSPIFTPDTAVFDVQFEENIAGEVYYELYPKSISLDRGEELESAPEQGDILKIK